MGKSKLNILGFIPARSNSKGIPHKNLRKLNGKPIMAYTIESALESKLLDRIILSTDSPDLAEYARSLGAEVPYIRPSHLATDKSHLGEAISHLAAHLYEKENYIPDIFVSLFPTNPFRRKGMIDEVLSTFLEDNRIRKIQGEYIVHVLLCSKNYYDPRRSVVVSDGNLVPFVDYMNLVQSEIPEKTYLISGSIVPSVYSEERWGKTFKVPCKYFPSASRPNGKDIWINMKTGKKMYRVAFFISDEEGIELDEPPDLFAALAVINSKKRAQS